MYLTMNSLGQMGGEVVVIPTLAPGTVVKSVYTTPGTSARSTVHVDVEEAQNRALSRVPWPHKFFMNFMLGPKVPAPAFYGSLQFTDPKLVQSGYFQNVGQGTDKDIAQYIYDNQDAFNAHFQRSVEEVIEAEKQNVERKKAEAKKKGIITMIAGTILSIVTLGAGVVVMVALAVAQAALSVYQAKQLSKEQIGHVKELLAYLGVVPDAMDVFRTWIISRVEALPEVPPLPEGFVPSARYTFFDDGNYMLQNNDPEAGLATMLGQTIVGSRVTVKDESSQTVYRVYLRVKEGFNGVPMEKARLAQTIPNDMAVTASGGSTFSPLALLAIPALLLATK